MKTIFVSSTFRDMHYERDTIHERVLPDLNEHAAQYGDSIAFCDLRWGVNTGDLENEEGSRKVLSVCFDEIDRCRPYMLVILGERYGWIPEPELTRETVGSRFILEDLEKSVTALEIEYGALSDSGRLARTLFYFREFDGPVPETYQQEDEYHAHKLEELKERIRKIAGDRVRTYHVSWDEEKERLDGMEDFSRQLIQDLKEMMQDEWIETASLEPFGRDQRFQWDFARQKAEQFRGRRELIDHLEARLKSEENLHAVTGAAGCGKSSLMSSMAVRLDEAGYRVLPIFCGSTVMTNCAHDIVSYIVRFLEECVGAEHFEEQAEADQTARRLSVGESKIDGSGGRVKDLDAWTKRLNEMVWNYAHSSEKELIILVDAVDQLFPDEARENLCFIPENLPDGVQMVVSFLDTFQAEGRQYLENVEDIGLLVQEEKTGVIQGILQSLGRELETAVIRKIEEKPGSDNPLYLSLIVQRLVMMNKEDFDRIAGSGDGMSAITAHQIKIVESVPETVSGLCADILQTASERIGGRIAEQAVQYIAASRYGLRESDLSRIFAMQGYDWKYGDREIRRHGVEWNSLEFALFIKYMRSFFILRDDGRWDFAHRTIREGIEERSTDEKECHQQIVNGLEGLDDRDPVKMTELLYHLCQADAREEFIRCMKDRDMSDKEMFDATADQIKTIILTDSGEWICRVIDEARQYEEGLDLSECITQTLRNALRGTKEELELVLSYGPDEIPEGGIPEIEYPYILGAMLQTSLENGGPVENHGGDASSGYRYSLEDANRLFSSFTDYQFTEETASVQGEWIIHWPVTINFSASAEITSAEYTEEEMDVYFTYVYTSYSPDAENAGVQTTTEKKAVLEPNEEGMYRIVSIEPVSANEGAENASAETEPEEQDPAQSGRTMQEIYADVLKAVENQEPGYEFPNAGAQASAYQYFTYDMDGDGIEELIVGAEFSDGMVGQFVVYDCRVFGCSETEGGYELKQIDGNVVIETLYTASDGNGLYCQEFMRGTGQVSTYRLTLQNGALTRANDPEYEFTFGDAAMQEFSGSNPAVQWTDISDLSGLS